MRMGKHTERQLLEIAYRTAGRLTRTGLFTGDIPKFKPPETLTALGIMRRAEALNDEIKYLESVLKGKVKPAFEIVGFDPTESEPEKKENKENLQRGIKILKKWRSSYNRHLLKAKAKQPFVEKKRQEAEKIVQRLHELKSEVEEFHGKTGDEVQKLEARLGTLSKEYNSLNLNPRKPFPSSLMQITAVKRLIKR